MGNHFHRTPKTFFCCNCQQEFASLSVLEKHCYLQHSNDTDFCGHKTFYCYGCDAQFRKYEFYVSHFRRGRKK